ncbi:MAG: DNA polymerase III subunit alpha, partial [Planctomycetota bacterium]
MEAVHLRVHTPHSHLFGASSIEDLVEAARRGGVRALAMTDRNGLYSPFEFQDACEHAGIQPLFGAHLRGQTLIARDEEGYRNLCFLISAHHLQPQEPLERLLREHGGGVTCLGPETAVVPVAYHTPGRRGLHRILRAVDQGRVVHQAQIEAGPLLSASTLRRRFPAAERRRAWRIAESCTLRLERRPPIFPRPPLPPGETAASVLFRLATEGVRRRYRPVPPEAMRRLLQEIEVIHEMGFDAYFLIVHEIVEFARRQQIAVVGRGSAANSIVAYVLGITNVDPIRYELLFERFLNRSRGQDPPDIDLDIDWRRRDEILEHVYETYGRERVAMICTFQTLRFRSAFREVAKAFGLSPDEVNRVSRRLPRSIPIDPDNDPELRGLPLHREPYPTILRAAKALVHFPRHLSIHSGGIVVADRDLTDYLPLQRTAKGLVVTQFDMHGVERTGLLKIDLLGHRSLAVVQDASRWAGIDLLDIPEEEPKAAELLRTGRTLGVFQIESPGMRTLLKKMRGTNQEDAMIGLSLIRPGPSGTGMKDAYVRRKRGEEQCDIPCLEALLPRTFGVLLYQEDVMRAAAQLAGLTLERADEIRRSLKHEAPADDIRRSFDPTESQEDTDAVLRSIAHEFMTGAQRKGMQPDQAQLLWSYIQNFVAFAYSKAHAATYGRISYQALYLKAHHPAAFLAAVLANGGGYYDSRTYVEEARRLGVRILLPDINRSAPAETVEEGALRIGLDRVRDLRAVTLEAILEHRPFLGLTDFLKRVSEAQRREVEHLVLTGCFDAFDGTRPEKLWRVLLHERAAAGRRSPDLFGERNLLPPERTLPAIREYTREKAIEFEQELLGLCPTAHPLTLYRRETDHPNQITAEALGRFVGRRVWIVGWVVTTRRIRTRKGEPMKFVTLEDETGMVEITFPAAAYRRCGHLLHGG